MPMPIKHYMFVLLAATLVTPLASAAPAGAQDCRASAPGIRVNISGLKDRVGQLKLELYPANQADFLQDDQALLKAGKVFRRVQSAIPQQGDVSLCIAAPHAGRYAVIVIHERDGKPKFTIARDGIGVPGSNRLGRSRPTVDQAAVTVDGHVITVAARMQYLRGLAGFGSVAE
jgi:uncharacterized protein (DUF2141 family)